MTPNLSLTEWLTWVFAGGGAAAFMSFVAERSKWFQSKTPAGRSYLTVIGSVVIAVAARAVLVYVPADVLAQIAPWFVVIAGTAAPWVFSQLAHKIDPAAKHDPSPAA